jgi:nucleoside diphosphate-linked moiety X motif protein 19
MSAAELLRKPPASPPALRPAASFIICATEEGGNPEEYKVLMIQRAARGPFGGLTVYPGGAVEEVDGDSKWRELLLSTWQKNGMARKDAEAVLEQKTEGDGVEVGLEYYVGAIREVGWRHSGWTRGGVPSRLSEAFCRLELDLTTCFSHSAALARFQTFEEVGLLLSYPRRPQDMSDAHLQELRKEVHNSAKNFPKVFEGTGMAPDVGRLVHWANW